MRADEIVANHVAQPLLSVVLLANTQPVIVTSSQALATANTCIFIVALATAAAMPCVTKLA